MSVFIGFDKNDISPDVQRVLNILYVVVVDERNITFIVVDKLASCSVATCQSTLVRVFAS